MPTPPARAITTTSAPSPVGPYSQAVLAGEWLYCSGQIPLDPLTGEILDRLDSISIYPAKHFVTPKERIDSAIQAIKQELAQQIDFFNSEGKLFEIFQEVIPIIIQNSGAKMPSTAFSLVDSAVARRISFFSRYLTSLPTI